MFTVLQLTDKKHIITKSFYYAVKEGGNGYL